MDELELLLGRLAREAPPQKHLDRLRQRVHASIRRRRITRWTLAAALVLGAWQLTSIRETEILLPAPGEALIAVPDLILAPPVVAAPISRRAPRPKHVATPFDQDTIQLASTDKNVIIYWSLE
ncbi:hypothetical protein [Bryobacter aggregatus]|uniref:hypothetical protein n=1 Tax=Bryobacter aggregatus TaxID=360054 RepID=UPI0004E146C6|nr:hypothetical protein [Bryobacter aggregatus]